MDTTDKILRAFRRKKQEFEVLDYEAEQGTGITIVHWDKIEAFICHALQQQKAEILGEIEEVIRVRLNYCQEQNGLPYCKNCGLDIEDLEKLKSKLK